MHPHMKWGIKEGAHALVVQAVEHLVVVGREDDGGRLDLVRQAHNRLWAPVGMALTHHANSTYAAGKTTAIKHKRHAMPQSNGEALLSIFMHSKYLPSHCHILDVLPAYSFLSFLSLLNAVPVETEAHADGLIAYCLQPAERAERGAPRPGGCRRWACAGCPPRSSRLRQSAAGPGAPG